MSRAWPSAFALIAAFAASLPARAATQEVHASGHDVHVRVDSAGVAEIDEDISYRVVGGVLKGFDLDGIPAAAALTPEVTVTADDGAATQAHVGPREIVTKPGADPAHLLENDGARHLRVDVADPKGLKRGNYTFHLHYREDLVAAGAFRRDGGLFRMAWASPPLVEGIDGMRVVLDLPAAPTEPRLARADAEPAPSEAKDDGAAEGALPTLRRTADRDVLEIVRPHVSRGEAVVWAARVDPRAFPDITSPELRPAPPKAPPPPDRSPLFTLVGLVSLGVLAALLAYTKLARAALSVRREGLAPRPLAALPVAVRAATYGALLAFAVRAELADAPTFGAALLVLAMASVTHLAPRPLLRTRGPGSWIAMKPSETLVARVPGDPLDATTSRGALVLVATLFVLAAVAWLARRLDPSAPSLVALDALVLAPIFFTGTRRQLPPDRARDGASVLRALYMRLRTGAGPRVTPWGRIPVGKESPDEVRLRVLPRAPLPGLLGIEVGVAFHLTPAGYARRPELLVRVHDGSAAAAKLTSMAPYVAPVPGRRADERVVRLLPAFPTPRALHALVARLTEDLVDRRLVVPADAPWKGTERRLPPNEKTNALTPNEKTNERGEGRSGGGGYASLAPSP